MTDNDRTVEQLRAELATSRAETRAAFENRAYMYAYIYEELLGAMGKEAAVELMKRAIYRRGLEVGAEILYMSVNGSFQSTTGFASGLAMGPFIGWKTTSHAGFTFDVQGGVEVVTLGASASDSSTTATDSKTDFIPLLNLNIGWSL